MANEAFVIRTAPSGPDAPAGTPGYVLTVQADGVSVAPEPPGAGGSVTPLTRVYNVDFDGTATTPTGAFSGDKAFNGATCTQDAVDVAAVVGDAVVLVAKANPTPEAVNLTPGTTATRICLRSWQLERSDGTLLSSFPQPQLGAVTCDMGGAPVAGLVQIEGFTLGSLALNGAGAYLAKVVQCTIAGNLTGAAQQPALYGSVVSGNVTGLDAIDLFDSTITGTLTTNTGIAIWRGSTVNGGTIDQCDAVDCKILGSLGGGTTAGGLKFRNCTMPSTVILSTCSLDATSELQALKAGAEFRDTIFALSTGQGGDASPVSGNITLNYSGPLRGIVCATTLTASITIVLDETSGIALQPFFLDIYNTTGHTITVHDSAAATLVVCATQAAGTGARYTFGISGTTGKVVLVTPREAL
jgi:hypothetical protein